MAATDKNLIRHKRQMPLYPQHKNADPTEWKDRR